MSETPFRTIDQGLRHAAYSAVQTARVLWYTGHYIAGRHRMGPLLEPGEAPYAERSAPLDRKRLQDSFRDVFQWDIENVKAGIYQLPEEVRHIPNPRNLFRASRDYLTDSVKVAKRKSQRHNAQVMTPARRGQYPRYYLQNFHYQSDGWLSKDSAERYEMQVETLFTGAAGPMRRTGLPFLRDILQKPDGGDNHLVDLGCGTGAFLKDVKTNWPFLSVTAIDLSPAYLAEARKKLSRWPDIEFHQCQAEETPFGETSVEIVTAVYLFHELPPKVRRQIAGEIARILKPGGYFILTDTLQYGDEPGLDILLENFPRGFHEPYYDSYCQEDLSTLFGEVGLTKQAETIGFLTKSTLFQKE